MEVGGWKLEVVGCRLSVVGLSVPEVNSGRVVDCRFVLEFSAWWVSRGGRGGLLFFIAIDYCLGMG